MDHDISLTGNDPANGTADIAIFNPFDPLGPNPIPFNRSNFDPFSLIDGNSRQQVNHITSFIEPIKVAQTDCALATTVR